MIAVAGPDFLHDFVHIYWPSVRAVAEGRDPAAGYHVGPFLLLELWFFGLFPLGIAKWIWFAGSIVEVGVVTWLGNRLLPRDAGLFPRCVLGILMLSSLPILDSLVMGQLGVLGALGVLATVWSLTQDDGTEIPDIQAGIFLGLTIAAKPSWAPWLLLLPALRLWRASIVAILTIILGHAVAALVFGFEVTWRVVVLSWERILELRATIANAPDSQHVAHVAQRWLHAVLGSEDDDAAARLAVLEPISIGIGILALGILVWRGTAKPAHALFVIAASSPFVVATSWPLDFALLPFLQALVFAHWLVATRYRRSAQLLLAASILLSNIAMRAILGKQADLGGATLLSVWLLAIAWSLTSGARPAHRPRAPTSLPAGA